MVEIMLAFFRYGSRDTNWQPFQYDFVIFRDTAP